MTDENLNEPQLEDRDLEFYDWQHPVDYGGMPGELEPPQDFVVVDDPGLLRRQKLWLQTDQMWQRPLYPIYRGIELLSTSSDCLVGHWSARTRFGSKHVVVKQRPLTGLTHSARPNLRDESQHYKNMQSLLQPGSGHHVVKMFRKAVVDEGKNTLAQDVGTVERMILEYCTGTLYDFIKQGIRDGTRISERQAWEIFHCLAHSVLIMNHGTENPAHYRRGGPGFNAVDIIHFNLNLRNAYLQDHVDGQHVSGIILKVGSFRRAVKVQRRQGERYHRAFHNRGDVRSRAPEQLYASDMRGMRPWLKDGRSDDRPGRGNTLQSVTYSSRTNVWQVGLIMFCIIHMIKEVDWDNVERIWDRSTERLATGKYTIGSRVRREEDFGFSRTLILTIRECLLIEPSARRNAAQLFEKTKAGLAQANLGAGLNPQQPIVGPLPQQVPQQVPPLELNLEPAPPEPRMDRPPSDYPMPDQQQVPIDIFDRRAAVEAEPDDYLPAYAYNAPAGHALPRSGWGEGLERPPPNYSPPRPADIAQFPPFVPQPAVPQPRHLIPRRPVGLGTPPQRIPCQPVGAPPRVPRAGPNNPPPPSPVP
ncbi:predicted protein [Sclerotinia sclerotiorum 1980 UF-70]|uniref:Protein kinase domain-containing protein n=2 Tax=Sclerotinia sclerotiorum (strain ATCC 18683 / 1980 / Ss-1) TaxID=665079 RepID=A7EC19_SCLS1|nr:predicted protein [Sclerotinia sclerotiorum 1980 UF-70]APA08993.1 hypothetical protein sscle_04g037630 [Sclerotinia sclerotiorum 1980 UF-70]EDN99997.1 predicted protein [Sclerotinia sclerotiorum 1980 UF-70]